MIILRGIDLDEGRRRPNMGIDDSEGQQLADERLLRPSPTWTCRNGLRSSVASVAPGHQCQRRGLRRTGALTSRLMLRRYLLLAAATFVVRRRRGPPAHYLRSKWGLLYAAAGLLDGLDCLCIKPQELSPSQ